MASRTLAKILIDSRLIFSFDHREALKAYLSNLQKVDIEALSLQCTIWLTARILPILVPPQNYQARPRQQ